MLTLMPPDRPPDAREEPDTGEEPGVREARLALDALHRGVLEDARHLRAIQVRMARRLLALRRAPSLYRFGATTFSLYCESIGLSAGEGRDLASLAEAAMVRPDVVPRFAAGRLSLGKVAALAHLLRLGPPVGSIPDNLDRPDESRGLEAPGEGGRTAEDRAGKERANEERANEERANEERANGERANGERDWVRTAEGVTTRDLWRLLEERRERQRLRESPEFVAMFVSRRGRQDFLRCRELVSRREWLPVTEGATLERVCDTFLGKNDPERRAARLAERDNRRGPVDFSVPTLPADGSCPPRDAAAPASARRPLPAALRRDLIRRLGDRCWVEGCDRRSFLEFAHRIPVRLGGGEAPDNLLRLCGEHHAQFDGKGWRLIPRRDGVVLLVDRRGVVVGRLRTAPGLDPDPAPASASAPAPAAAPPSVLAPPSVSAPRSVAAPPSVPSPPSAPSPSWPSEAVLPETVE